MAESQSSSQYSDSQQYAQSEESQTDQQYLLPNQPQPEYLLLEWFADSRLAMKRSREYYSSLAVIVLLLSLILFFANQVLLIFVLVSFLFVTYVLASVQPDTIHLALTSYGIQYRDRLYYWEELGRFWVTQRAGYAQVHIEAPAFMANQIILLPSNQQSPILVTVDDIVSILSRYIPYEEPNPTQIDRWVQLLEEKFPLESTSAQTSTQSATNVRVQPDESTSPASSVPPAPSTPSASLDQNTQR